MDTTDDRLHTASMPNVLIRGVPEPVHQELRRRAEQAGQSLQHYLQQLLAETVATPTIADWVDEARAGANVAMTGAEIAALIRADRESH